MSVIKKKVNLVIPFLYVETMGMNGVDTPGPHFVSAMRRSALPQ